MIATRPEVNVSCIGKLFFTKEKAPETDPEVEACLAAATEDQWSAMRAALSEIMALDAPGEWCGGNVTAPTEDGNEIIEMPFISYAAPVRLYEQLWYDMDLVVPNLGIAKDALERLEWMDHASIADVVRFGSAILRGDRFSEGLLGYAIESGAIAAVVEKLQEWRENQAG